MCNELRWLPPERYPDREERDEYDDMQSMSFIALDSMGNCIGTSRLIFPGELALPVETHFNLYPKEFIEAIHGTLRNYAEISRFIVPGNQSLKKHEITLMLCRAMTKMAIKMRATHMFMSADYRFFRLLRILGFHLEEIGEPMFYMGSKTIPGILPVENLMPVLKEKKPSLYNYLSAGKDMVEDMATAPCSAKAL